MVEIYRDCMYDTMVMHLAVFPENESLKRDVSHDHLQLSKFLLHNQHRPSLNIFISKEAPECYHCNSLSCDVFLFSNFKLSF